MIRSLRKKIKRMLRPPKRGGIRVTGHYASWEAATRDSAGYDSAVILEKTCQALLKVKRGEAVYERDSVIFDQVAHAFPVLAGLLRAAQADGGRLCVVDFGGSLGSSYFQCREFLRVVRELRWLVVEQAAHVACGRANFESEELRFLETIELCAPLRPNALLLSSVLPYLREPYLMLEALLRQRPGHVIIDRTGFLASGRERLAVQHVPDTIYPASYPVWFFSEPQLRAAVEAAGYRLTAEFPGTDKVAPDDEPAYYKGFIFERTA